MYWDLLLFLKSTSQCIFDIHVLADSDRNAFKNVSHFVSASMYLTNWGWVIHICVSKFTIFGSYNGLSPRPRQVIIWTNVTILLIWPSGTRFSEILFKILTFSFNKNVFEYVVCEMSTFMSQSQCISAGPTSAITLGRLLHLNPKSPMNLLDQSRSKMHGGRYVVSMA